MLEQLLLEIRSGGTYTVGSLADKLGTTPELVQAMLDHLQASGRLNPYQACRDACSGCGLADSCKMSSKNQEIRLWQA